MVNRKTSLVLITASALLFGAVEAQAHPGHGNYGLAGGFQHPFSGIDHLLAMIAVGLWAVQIGGRALYLLPLSFVSVMLLGGVSVKMGIHIANPDALITTSLLIFGLLIATSARLPVAVGAVIVGLFAFFHGYSHVQEGVLEQGNFMLGFAIGFILATMILHAVGISLGLAFRSPTGVRWVRFAGAGIAICAVMIWVGWVHV